MRPLRPDHKSFLPISSVHPRLPPRHEASSAGLDTLPVDSSAVTPALLLRSYYQGHLRAIPQRNPGAISTRADPTNTASAARRRRRPTSTGPVSTQSFQHRAVDSAAPAPSVNLASRSPMRAIVGVQSRPRAAAELASGSGSGAGAGAGAAESRHAPAARRWLGTDRPSVAV